MAITLLKDELANPSPGIEGQRCVSEVHDLQDLMVRDAWVHEACRDMNSKAKSRESASSFEATGDIIRQCDPLPCNPEDHFARLDHQIASVLDMDAFGDVLEPRAVVDMVDLGQLLKYPEVVPERKIDGSRSDL